jgi:hypothetical protein
MKDKGLYSKFFGSRGTTNDLPFNTKALLTRAIICIQRKIFANHRGYGAYAFASKPMDLDESIDTISEMIKRGVPFMAG